MGCWNHGAICLASILLWKTWRIDGWIKSINVLVVEWCVDIGDDLHEVGKRGGEKGE